MVIRSGPQDFGYTFVKSEEEAEDGTNTDVETGEAQKQDTSPEQEGKPYIYKPLKRYKSGIGPHAGPSSLSRNGIDYQKQQQEEDVLVVPAIGCFGACCCCLTVLMLVAGGALLVSKNYVSTYKPNSSVNPGNLLLSGSILLIVGGTSLLCVCCTFCFACASMGVGSNGDGVFSDKQWEDAHKDVHVSFQRLNDRLDRAEDALDTIHMDVVSGLSKEVRVAQRKEAQQRKEEERQKKEELQKNVKRDLERGLTLKEIRRNCRPVAFLVKFHGDSNVSEMELLRKQVSIIVHCGRAGVDQAVVVVTSPGGSVSHYGLAASQLVRIRKAGIRLVVCVDDIAASGGYMLASVGDHICAAPFAIIGSIGVVTQIPNFQRFLNKNDIDAYLFTAGKHKRTIDIIGEVTEENKAKLQEELDEIHTAFKDHVALARPKVRDNIEEISTGEFWLAVEAKKKGLVDEIMTSDEYLESIREENEIIELVEKKKRSVWSSFHEGAAKSIKGAVDGISSLSHLSPKPMAI